MRLFTAITLALTPLLVSPQTVTAAAVLDAPSAPTSIQVSPGSTSILVTWVKPTNLAGRTITGYQVEYSTDGVTGWQVSSSSVSSTVFSYTISGLSSGVPYYVRVAAKYSGGLGAYGYPWTKIYGTVTPTRSSGLITYQPGYGLAAGDASSRFASANFSRVRYLMSVNYGSANRYVDADFAKTLNPLSSYSSSFDSIANLRVPTTSGTGSQFVIQGDVADLNVQSNDSNVKNGNGLSGRLELWPWDYQVNGATGLPERSASTFDDSDTPLMSAAYGSFQLHDITDIAANPKHTIFAWNNMGATPEIGFGNQATGSSDWTFCSRENTCTGRTNFVLETFVNIPTVPGSSASGSMPSSFAGNNSNWSSLASSGTTPSISGFSSTVRVVVTTTNGVSKISTTTGLTAPTGYLSTDWTNGSASLGFEGTQAQVNSAIATLSFKGTTPGTPASIKISAILGGAAYNPDNGHYYEIVNSGSTIGWQTARSNAKNRTFNGMKGYLATVTSQAEQDFLYSKTSSTGWFGGTDGNSISPAQQTWMWADGPEAGQIFWTADCNQSLHGECSSTGSLAFGKFSFWNSGEPNGSNGSEDNGEFGFGTGGQWNDCQDSCNRNLYIVEYGGMGETPSQQFEATTSVSVSGVPAAPTISLTDGNGQLTVTVSHGTDYGSAITDIKYQLSTNSGGTWGSTVSTGTTGNSFVISGLTNGAAYTVRVLDTNTYGDGAWSNTPTATPKTVPNAPTLNSVVADNNSLSLRFTPSTTAGAAVTGYEYSTDDGSSWKSLSGTTSPQFITSTSNPTLEPLVDGSTYTVIIRATSAVGNSSNSNSKSGVYRAATNFAISDFKLGGLSGKASAAYDVASNEVTLTTANTALAGSLWTNKRLDLTKDFVINASVYLGANDSGADGLAFVLQPNDGNQLTSGGGLGYGGISNSFAVEFDTYYNGSSDPVSQDHISYVTAGRADLAANHVYTYAPTNYNLEDGTWRDVRFVWVAATKTFITEFEATDGAVKTQIISASVDLPTLLGTTAENPTAYWGFTAATGGSVNLQKVKVSSFTFAPRANTAPVITQVTNKSVLPSGSGTYAITFTDDLSTQSQLSISATSSNTNVVPAANLSASITSATGASVSVTGGSTPGTSTISVTIMDADGVSSTSTFDVTVIGPPDAPTLNSVSGSSGAISGTLTFGDSKGTDFTNIKYVTSLDGVNWSAETATGNALTNFNISGLTNGFTYFVKIKAVTAAGTSDWSNVLSAKVNSTGINAPNVWGLLAAGERTKVLGTETASNATLLNNGTYFYNAPNASIGFSPNGTISQNSADIVDSPLSGSCTSSNSGAQRLSWHRSNGNITGGWRYGCATGLNADNSAVRAVYQSNNPAYYPSGPQANVSDALLTSNGWEQCYIGGYGTAVSFSSVATACTKTYIILAGGAGASVTVLNTPSITSNSNSDTELKVNFSPSSNADANTTYSVVLYSASSGGLPIRTITGVTSGAVLTGLSPSTTYFFTLMAVGNNGTRASSLETSPRISFTTSATISNPNSPVITSSSSGDRVATVNLQSYLTADLNGGTFVRYEYRLGSAGSWTSAGATTPIEITGLVNGTTYDIYLRAVTSNGVKELFSAATTRTTLTPNLPPTNTSAPTFTGDDWLTGDDLTWTSNGTWTGGSNTYTIQWQRKNLSTNLFEDISPNGTQTTYRLTESDIGTYIRLKVTASNSSNIEGVAFSNPTLVIKDQPADYISRPRITGTPTAFTQISVSEGNSNNWRGTNNRYEYKWYRVEASGDVQISGATSSSYTLTADDVDKEIYATVTARNSYGHTTVSTSRFGQVQKAAQTIFNFSASDNKPFSAMTRLVTAENNRNLKVEFESLTPEVCAANVADLSGSISSSLIEFIKAGTCSIKAKHSGTAGYLASNEVTQEFVIEPSAPTIVRNVATAVSGTKITASWSTPTGNGGSAISRYLVTATAGADSFTCTTSTTTCDIDGLIPGTSYDVTVVATNTAVGLSSAKTSNPSTVLRTAIPAASVSTVTGNIPTKVTPKPVTSILGVVEATKQTALINSGVIAPPPLVPVINVSADLSSGSIATPTTVVVSQTVESGAQIDLAVKPPTDTPVGTPVYGTLILADGTTYDLGQLGITSVHLTDGFSLAPFTILPVGTHYVELRFGETTTVQSIYSVVNFGFISLTKAAPSINALSTGSQINIKFAINIVAGANGVPTIQKETPNPTPTPTRTPTPTPSVTEEPTVAPTPTPEPSVQAQGEPQATVDARGLPVTNPLTDAPLAVAQTTLTAVALVAAVTAATSAASAVAAAAGAAASAGAAAGGAAGAASGGAGSGSASRSASSGSGSGGSSSSSGSSGGSGSGGSGEGGEGEDDASIEGVEFEHDGFEAENIAWGDDLKLWSIPVITALDEPSHRATEKLAPITPLVSKLIADPAYLKAMLGSLSLIFPILGVLLGLHGVSESAGQLLPPTAPIITAIAVIGVLDAFAGFIAMAIYTVGMIITAGVHNTADVRMLLGLVIIGFGPSLLASAFRGLRRQAIDGHHYWWERLTDFAVAPFLGGWATKGMVEALTPLAGVELPIHDHANAIAWSVAIALAVRIALEEISARYFPSRLNFIHPTDVPSPTNLQKVIALTMRAAIFFFVAGAFIGNSWHLYVGTFLFIAPSYLALIQDRFPNYPRLYQILPAGLPGLAFTLLVASASLTALTSALGETPDLAQIAFVVLPIPSVILSVLGMFGREPAEGDVRWYQRAHLTWLYRIGGILMLAYTMHLTGII